MFERWTLRSRFSRQLLVATWSSMRDSERARALSPHSALWELQDALHDASSRFHLCDMCRDGAADFSLIQKHELIRMVSERVKSGELLVAPLEDEPFYTPAPVASPIEWIPPGPAVPVTRQPPPRVQGREMRATADDAAVAAKQVAEDVKQYFEGLFK
jgi:hypothetical protein